MILEIDGSQGEGGGQILRTALALSMCTGQGMRIVNIRARRRKPGLMRQHLTAVQAAAAICGAEVQGAAIGGEQLTFHPGKVRGGRYRFCIGTAGSCTLVLQTILPALLIAGESSEIRLEGGTHNPMSPPFHFLQRSFMPLLQRMGAKIELSLERFGFYPAGGGVMQVKVRGGCKLKALHLPARGERIRAYAESFFAALPMHIAERELKVVGKRMGWQDDQLLLRAIDGRQGPGNALLLTLEHEHSTEVFTGFGEKGVSAEAVAEKTVAATRRFLASNAAVDEYLTDQLLLPLALAGGGSFTAAAWSRHAATNAEVIRQFLDIAIDVQQRDAEAYIFLKKEEKGK